MPGFAIIYSYFCSHSGVVMKKFYTLICSMILFVATLAAQTSQVVEVAVAKPQGTVAPISVGTKKGGIELPPEKARPVTIPKFAAPIVIDGKPDEAAWKDAAVFKDFYQTSPGDNVAPSKPTEAMVMYDEKNLYVAFKCWDDK